MKSRGIFVVLVLALVLSACNLPSNAPVTETPTVEVTPTPTLFLTTETATQTAIPSATSPPTASPTPSVPVAFPRDVAVNCRLGPGTGWIVLSGLSVGATSQITGVSSDRGWWQIIDPLNSSRRCWVAASVTNTAGNVSNIPVVEAPQASVTNVSVDVDPRSLSVAGCLGPILPLEISGTIETNGPTTVRWHFETQLDGAMPNQTTQFDTFGEETFGVDYTPTLTAGTYWIRLIVTEPNEAQSEVSYTITCP